MRSNAIVLSLAALLVLAACNSSPTAPGSTSLEVLPATASMTAGRSVQLTVTGQGGGTITEGITWRSAAPHVVDVSASGVATAMYGSGTIAVRAAVGTASGQSQITVLAACASPAPLEGSPPSEPGSTQAFEVRLTAGADAAKRAQQLSQQIGFAITEVTASGFIATLTPQQVSTIRCVVDVDALSFV